MKVCFIFVIRSCSIVVIHYKYDFEHSLYPSIDTHFKPRDAGKCWIQQLKIIKQLMESVVSYFIDNGVYKALKLEEHLNN